MLIQPRGKELKLMEKFIALIQLLTLLKVEFRQISADEIIVECPCDIVNDFAKVTLCQKTIIDDPTTCAGWDEICVHIAYNEKYDSLDWLVVDYQQE
jgi:hypothetical protein